MLKYIKGIGGAFAMLSRWVFLGLATIFGVTIAIVIIVLLNKR